MPDDDFVYSEKKFKDGFGKELREKRNSRRLSQETVARRVGYANANRLSDFELDYALPVDIWIVQSIAKALHLHHAEQKTSLYGEYLLAVLRARNIEVVNIHYRILRQPDLRSRFPVKTGDEHTISRYHS